MRVNSTVQVRELTADTLLNTCPACSHVDKIDLTDPELSATVTKDVSFTLPDKMIMRDEAGRAQGAVSTIEVLEGALGDAVSG